MSEKSASIKLSVVVVSPYSHDLLRNCLDSVLNNKVEEKIEILVSDSSVRSNSNLMKDFPNVQFIQCPANSAIPKLAAAGIAQADGEIIAITDSSCLVDSNWISSIITAHQSENLVIGGCVEIVKGMKVLDLAAYFCEYGQFMLPFNSSEVDVLAGNNISFKRSVLKIETQYVEPEFWKTYWCQALQAKGISLISEPSIIVYYTKSFELFPFLVRRFHHGRCFAGMRINEISFAKRLFYLVGTIILPFIFLSRTITAIIGKRRFLPELLRSIHYIFLAILFWSIGETCGYLGRNGKSCDGIC